MNLSKIFLICGAPLLLVSCSSSQQLETRGLVYESIRTTHGKADLNNNAQDGLNIYVTYSINEGGGLVAVVSNLSQEIMIIDQTSSFFVNTDGKSTSYYDPTVRTTTVTNMESQTVGASVNLGAIAGSLGIGGGLRTGLNGINVGGAETIGQNISNSEVVADMPRITLAPRSSISMSKVFKISGIGHDAAKLTNNNYSDIPYSQSNYRFSVCISYSVDGGETFEKMVTNFYMNSYVSCAMTKNGQNNEAFRRIYSYKPDAIHEPLHFFFFLTNQVAPNTSYKKGLLYDYQ